MRQSDCHFYFVFSIVIWFRRWGCINDISKSCESEKWRNSWKKKSIFINPEANCALDTIICNSMWERKHCSCIKSIVLVCCPSIISEAITYLRWNGLRCDRSQGTMTYVYSFSIKNSLSYYFAVFITLICNSDLESMLMKR
jgi:hypothetical protein